MELILENIDHWIFRLQQFWMIDFIGNKCNFWGRKSLEDE